MRDAGWGMSCDETRFCTGGQKAVDNERVRDSSEPE